MKSIQDLISHFAITQNSNVTSIFQKHKRVTLSGVGNFSAKSFIISELLQQQPKIETVVWIVNGPQEQATLIKDLNLWGSTPIFDFSYLTSQPHKQQQNTDRINQIKALEFIARAQNSQQKVIVVPYSAMMTDLTAKGEIDRHKLNIKIGDEMSAVDLIENLLSMDYELSEDNHLAKGTYFKSGSVITVFPFNSEKPLRLDLDFDQVAEIIEFDLEDDSYIGKKNKTTLYALSLDAKKRSPFSYLGDNSLVIEDELDITDEHYNNWNDLMDRIAEVVPSISMTAFNEDGKAHCHLHYLSVLKFRSAYDLVNDLREKCNNAWRVIILTKNHSELKSILEDSNFQFVTELEQINEKKSQVFLIEVDKDDVFPEAFQNPDLKFAIFTDRDISTLREESKKNFNRKVYLDFLTGLKAGDYVVHSDHGIALFLGLERKTIDAVTREYLKLGYAENDKLYVPIDQADKVNKYIGAEDTMPKLTRLGSAEWSTINKKVKKEAQKIAKDLLEIFAKRKQAKGFKYKDDSSPQAKFEATFPYEETPGQIKAINDVKSDMEKAQPMDRLVCGDVGFGKTEVAMRAAFKAVQSGKQVAVISPITILADQHYRSFSKRMEEFHVRVEMLSRFRTAAQQKKILDKLAKGELDIVVGTHRLLQPDVNFKNLGLLIIDEEQRFGVKQKEHFKSLRSEIDILTLTATPIPRTMNICLNKLREVSIISTPPPGRLPVITEVRRFSNGLIRDAIMKELDRGGQVYFLHNRVQTIDSMASKLQSLVPEARFCVAHGKLGSGDLEDRIVAFKEHKFDVLVSSTIIENGIDLANANTLIVNNAERFGLAQLYQLRGRVGRGKSQAYAYFLYEGQRLKLDAKKRLRAIVEASELGSGFQIAMKDLEIRGVGDILGASQHGVMNVVGVSHFIRMLNKAVEDLEAGRNVKGEGEEAEVSIELPLPAFIPDGYIASSKDKINAYQRLASASDHSYLRELQEDLTESYGKMPKEVANLFRILDLKLEAKAAGITNIKAENIHMKNKKQIVMKMSSLITPHHIMNLLEFNPKWIISGTKLKISLDDLGVNWFDILKINVTKLKKPIKRPGEKD